MTTDVPLTAHAAIPRSLIVGQMIAKIVLSAVLVPAMVYAFVAIGRKPDA